MTEFLDTPAADAAAAEAFWAALQKPNSRMTAGSRHSCRWVLVETTPFKQAYERGRVT
jgi:hypothetical protein